MKQPLSLKAKMLESLPLSLKLRLKRAIFRPVALVTREAERARSLVDRILSSSTRLGLDLERVRHVSIAKSPYVYPFGVHDFLFLMNAIRDHVMPAVDRPIRISIVILAYNKIEYTFQCLRSVFREVNSDDTEIIVVDNGSCDETARVLSCFEGFVRVITFQKNVGFIDACNEGARAARGQYLVLLNNDVVVLPGWLQFLFDTIQGDQSIGAVGSMLIYPNGLLQEAGSIVWKDGGAMHYGWGRSPEERRFNFAREVDYCSGASFLIRKEIFDQLGGFDRRFAPAYYEDVDLCFGVRALGYKVVYQPFSKVIHHEGVTLGRNINTGFKRFQVINRQKFYEKWSEVLERDHYPNKSSNIDVAANRKRGPYVFVFDDRVPTPDRDAGSSRMLFILKSLAEWSKPVFVPISKSEWPEYEEHLWKEGVETVSPLEYHRLLKKRKVHAAILSRPHIAAALIKHLRRASSNIRIIYDMVDAHFIRFEREYRLSGEISAASEAKRYRKIETRLAQASDLVWCASTEDRKAMERQAPGVPIAIIPTIHKSHDRGELFEGRKDLLFIGNLRHRPNADGLLFYLREIYPLVLRTLPSLTLHVVGEGANEEISAYASDALRLHGYVPDAAPFFRVCRLMVAPLRFGAGAKGKIGESLSYGLPVITTPIGAEGMGFTDGEELLIAGAPQEFADKVELAYHDRELWQRLSDKGHAFVEKHLSPNVIGPLINETVRGG